MKAQPTAFSFVFLLSIGMFAGTAILTPSAKASPTLWTGANTNFFQTNTAPSDVLIPGAVVLTRAVSHALFNSVTEAGAGLGCPGDTEWAFGSLADFASLTYQPLYNFRNGDLSGVLVTAPPSPMVMHIIHEDIYLQVTFTKWPHGGGFFAYTRSTPAAVVAPKPTVNLTSPTNGATFAAPANVTLTASASVSSGTVTNVAFFGNGTLLGSKQSAPFTITANNLTGPYSLTAVAMAAGISATSTVINVTSVAPVTTALASATAENNKFSFHFNASTGLRYVVESSSNLLDWTPIITNVAASSSVPFTNDILPGGSFYRVGRLPNP